MHTQLTHPIEIGILLYPNVQMSAVLGLSDLFKFSAKSQLISSSEPFIKISHWQLDTSTNLIMRTDGTAHDLSNMLDLVILPPSLETPISTQLAAPYISWLQDQHKKGTILVSICAGAFLLAETGLIQNRSITLHWQHKELFEQRFPLIRLDLDQLMIDQGDIITAGGVMAWVDLGLRLVERYLGYAVMHKTAQTFLVDPPGRQQSYYRAFLPKLDHGDEAILKVQQWLNESYAQKITLDNLADYACMEERTFLRRFKQSTGMTSIEYCQRLRVDHAREKLQTTRLPVDRIAWQVGYSDPSAFRKVFSRIVGLTPSEYRQRFHPK